MKTYILLLLLGVGLATSCDDTSAPEQICNVNDPVEELDWLQARIDELSTSELKQYFYVTRATYGLRTVFIFRNCCPFCSSIIPVYSCSGVHLGNVSPSKGDIDPAILDNDVIVWKSADFACTHD